MIVYALDLDTIFSGTLKTYAYYNHYVGCVDFVVSGVQRLLQ